MCEQEIVQYLVFAAFSFPPVGTLLVTLFINQSVLTSWGLTWISEYYFGSDMV
jgi:hypothetical protein